MAITEKEARLQDLLKAIDEMKRGCDCDYDYRCVNCSRLLKVKRLKGEYEAL